MGGVLFRDQGRVLDHLLWLLWQLRRQLLLSHFSLVRWRDQLSRLLHMHHVLRLIVNRYFRIETYLNLLNHVGQLLCVHVPYSKRDSIQRSYLRPQEPCRIVLERHKMLNGWNRGGSWRDLVRLPIVMSTPHCFRGRLVPLSIVRLREGSLLMRMLFHLLL